jgi:hypothetical protein
MNLQIQKTSDIICSNSVFPTVVNIEEFTYCYITS